MWWALYGVALGARVTVADAEAMIQQLAPEVEARTGRSFVKIPAIDIATREMLRPRLLQPPVRMELPATSLTPGPIAAVPQSAYVPSEAEIRLADHLVNNAMAVYAPRDESIYLVKDAFDEIGKDYELDPSALVPMIRCLLVHELVHALQHQYGVEDDHEPDLYRGLLALHEGQSVKIASDYCVETQGEPIARLMENVQGIELEASLSPDDPAAVYAWGRQLAGQLQADGLIWSAFLVEPPSFRTVTEAIVATHPPRWRDANPLVDALDALAEEGRTIGTPVATSPASLLSSFFESRWGLEAMPKARGGFLVESETARQKMLIAAFLVETSTAPALLERRRTAIDNARKRHTGAMFYSEMSGDLVAEPKSKTPKIKDPPAELVDSLVVRTKSTGDGPYREYWLATPQRLLVLMVTGRQPNDADVIPTLLGVFEAMAPDPGPPFTYGPLTPWLETVRAAVPRTDAQPSWQYRLQHAARSVSLGNREACTHTFGPLLVAGATADPLAFAAAAFECASATEDVALAKRAAQVLPRLEPSRAVFFAGQMANASRPTQALFFLDKADLASLDDPELVRIAASVRVSAAVQLQRWATASDLLRRHTDLDASLRAFAGSEMYNAGRRSEGRRLIAEACPALEGEARLQCKRFLRGR